MRRPPPFRTIAISLAAILGLVVARGSLRAGPGPALVAATAVGGAFRDAPGEGTSPIQVIYLAAPSMNPAELKARLMLKSKVDMVFPDDTPLEAVLKHVSSATRDQVDFPDGLPLHVDKVGLDNVDKTMLSTVTINLKGMPVELTLALVLRQLGLFYRVSKEGLLVITSSDDDVREPVEPEREILSNLSTLRAEVLELRREIRALRPVAREEEIRPMKLPGGFNATGEISGAIIYTPRRFRVAE